MVWLWYLNLLYLAALYYLPNSEAVWALVSYLLILPMAAGFIVKQRGLTRLSGCMHFTWFIYVVYLGMGRLTITGCCLCSGRRLYVFCSTSGTPELELGVLSPELFTPVLYSDPMLQWVAHNARLYCVHCLRGWTPAQLPAHVADANRTRSLVGLARLSCPTTDRLLLC